MARKPKRQRKAPTAPPPRGTSDRDKAVDALMALLAEHPFEDIGLAEVPGRAGLKLSQLRAEFGSTLAIVGAHIKDIDRAVLAGGGGDMAEEPARERLFDVLMRRLEALAPYKEAVRSQGAALMFARVLSVWFDDDEPGLDRTMAALGRGLASAERWAGFVDDL